MERFKTSIWLTVICFCALVDTKLQSSESIASVDNIENLIQYEYKYKVDEGTRSGPVMDRWERRLGDHVKGSYSVLQPDGSVRTVDYEVDGEDGYRAITRLTPPASDLLSFQQLTQSDVVFPNPTFVNQHEGIQYETPPAQPEAESSENLYNYHSKPPYINKRALSDYKASASTNLATIFHDKTPQTPANYNVPLSKSLIYYKRPAGKIMPSVQIDHDVFNIDAHLPAQSDWRSFMYKTGITEIVTKRPEFRQPVKRHSRLVRRFKSMNEAQL